MSKEVKNRRKDKTFLEDVALLLVKILAILVAFFLLFSFVFRAFRYGDLSMKPNVKEGDMVISYIWDKRYSFGDVVAYSYEDEMTCSRVVATAGDKVDFTDGKLLINDKTIQDLNAVDDTYPVEDGVTLPLQVPEGKVFVLGDNRKYAVDSRTIGCIDIEKTQGKVIGILRSRGI